MKIKNIPLTKHKSSYIPQFLFAKSQRDHQSRLLKKYEEVAEENETHKDQHRCETIALRQQLINPNNTEWSQNVRTQFQNDNRSIQPEHCKNCQDMDMVSPHQPR